VTALDDTNAVICLIPQLSEVKQLGQLWLSNSDIIGAHIRHLCTPWVIWPRHHISPFV
jgi:hypothetical protein